MNILVINLTRFGDLLQSQAALSGIAARGHRVGMVCLENFRDTAVMLRHVDALFPLRGGTLLSALDGAWPEAVLELETWSRNIHAGFAPDRILNLTPTTGARLLGRFLAASGAGGGLPYDGFALDERGFGVNGNAWAAFMQGASRVRGVSPFNVADLFRKVAEWESDTPGREPDAAKLPDPSLAPPSASAMEAARRLLELPGVEGVRGYVALQAGASEDRRRWPAEYFAALGERLWREAGLCPVLLGSSGERELVDRVAGLMDAPSVNVAGKTSLGELGAVLLACRLLVSNDTGTLHLAAGLGTPVLGIFLATAQPWDTGPYRAGSCSLEPDLACHPCAFGKECPHDEMCRRALGVESVAGLALHFLRTGEWRNAASYAGVRAWESCRDDEGFMGLHSLSGHDAEDRSRWLDEQRWFYRQFLDRDQSVAFSPTVPDSPLLLSAPMAEGLRKDLYAAITLLDALIQQGELLLVKPLPQIKERFFASFTRIGALLQESPHLAALRLLWMEDASGSAELDRALRLAGQYHALLSCFMRRITL